MMVARSPREIATRHAVSIPCRDGRDRLVSAAEAHKLAKALGFGAKRSAEIAICAAELAGNAVKHAGGGRLVICFSPDDEALVLECVDRGPGLDAERAFDDGWSRGRQLGPDDARSEGLGSGLGAIRRMATAVSASSGPDGTIVRARFLR
jgi:serine/threonine-protein kinase RsbT